MSLPVGQRIEHEAGEDHPLFELVQAIGFVLRVDRVLRAGEPYEQLFRQVASGGRVPCCPGAGAYPLAACLFIFLTAYSLLSRPVRPKPQVCGDLDVYLRF